MIGKLLIDRTVSKDIVRTTLIKGRRPSRNLSFKVIGENLFLLDFQHEWDRIRVLEGRPWVFEGSLFSVDEFDGVTPPASIDFEMVSFWVRMYNLSLACMEEDVGHQIGSTMGIVEAIDTDEEGIGWGKFLRVRVKVDLKQPISRGRMLKVKGKFIKLAFQYECLPHFCFHCGIIRRGVVGCLAKREPIQKGAKPQFGPWL